MLGFSVHNCDHERGTQGSKEWGGGDSTLSPSEWLRSKTQDIAHAGGDVEQGAHSSIAGGSANLYNHFGHQLGIFLRKLGIVLPQDPAIPLLDLHPKDAPPFTKTLAQLGS